MSINCNPNLHSSGLAIIHPTIISLQSLSMNKDLLEY